MVGIGCRFPGGVLGPQSYWELLANGDFARGADRWLFTDDYHWNWRIEDQPLMTLFEQGWFGVLALGLACVGLCGVLSYVVSRRTTEFGIRMALGASAARVGRSVMYDALVLTGPTGRSLCRAVAPSTWALRKSRALAA